MKVQESATKTAEEQPKLQSKLKKRRKKKLGRHKKKVKKRRTKRRKNLINSEQIASGVLNQPNSSQPSTSREALATSSKRKAVSTKPKARTSPIVRRKRTFVKFKDTEYRAARLKEHLARLRMKKTFGSPLRLLVADSTTSRSQIMSRKILYAAKKYTPPNKENKNDKMLPDISLEDITVSFENTAVKDAETETKNMDFDDDCVCIDSPPEIIVVDDDSVSTKPSHHLDSVSSKASHYLDSVSSIASETNESLASKSSYHRRRVMRGSRLCETVTNPVLKPYDPIGTIRLIQQEENNLVTSTPKSMPLSLRWPGAVLNPLSPVLFDKTNTKKNVVDKDVVIIDDATTPSEKTNQLEEKTLVPTDDVNKEDVIFIDDSVPTTSTADKAPAQTSSEHHSNSANENETITAAKDHASTSSTADDSVIFISENIIRDVQPSTAPAFIPINTPEEESRFRNVPVSPSTPPVKRPRHDLFNSREQRQLRVYNENAYNPHRHERPSQTKKRMVIIDGSNVAYHHALRKEFSVKGLQICLEYFEKIGHEVKAVVPQFRVQRLKSSDPAALEKLNDQGKVIFTPCKNLPGKSAMSYDDRFILQLAAELDAAIVSNDNYRDLIHENPAFKKIIENRVIGFTWCNDLFILPKDPYGKWGPTLADILKRS